MSYDEWMLAMARRTFLRGALTLAGIAVAFLLWVISTPAEGAESSKLWGVATVTSYHYDRSKDHNEKNFGLGLEYNYNETWSFSGGFYRNSLYKQTEYLGATGNFAKLGPANLGICLCLVTGYSDKVPVEIIPMPVVSVNGKEWGANVGVGPAVVGLQIKRRF